MLNPNLKVANGEKKRKPSENGAAKSTNGDIDQQKKKRKRDLYKVPNVEEINKLQAAERQTNSNFFQLQIDELLKETKLSEKRQSFAVSFVESLEKFLLSLKPEDERKFVSDLKWTKPKNICLPLSGANINFDDSIKCFFQFLTPTSVFVSGSWRTATLIASNPTINICMEMPSTFFQKADHMNGIYHRKRALYLAYVALKLRDWSEITQCQFNYQNDDPLQPIIVLKATGKHGKHLTFELRATCESDSFKIERFAPEKSNVKILIKGKKKVTLKNDEHTATPSYNSSILRDLTAKANDEFLAKLIDVNPSVRDAIVLLKVWCRQRCFDRGFGRLSSHVLTMFVVQLIQSGKISTAMSSYQILRQVWIHFANTSWNESGKSLSLFKGNAEKTPPTSADFHQHFDVVLVDPSGFYNLCANVSLDLYLRIRRESSTAVQLLNEEQTNTFRCLFATKYPLYVQVDHIVQLPTSSIEKLQNKCAAGDLFDFRGFWLPHIQKLLFDVLRKGLSHRARALVPIVDDHPTSSWDINVKHLTKESQIQFGLILDSEFSFDLMDKGPQSNLPEAEEFRRFWGSKSELRRFRDGTMTEACVWANNDEPLVERRMICQRIVKHLLSHHFGLAEDAIQYTANELDSAYSLDRSFIDFFEGPKNSEQLAMNVIKSFDELAKQLRSLENVPLSITSVLGKSPVFRYCELFPLVANARVFNEDEKVHYNAHVINEGIIQFETSAKWPNDYSAIQRVKAAFNLQIVDELRKKYKLRTKTNIDSIDVLKDGYLFRLKIGVSREIAMLKKETTTKGVTKYRDTPESLRLEREIVLLPRITVSLHSLYHQHSAFGPTVLIAKRWLASQLLDTYLWPDEITELLIAYQFTCDKSDNPTQPQTAFFRFLHLLANADWSTDLILLNFNDELTKDYIEKFEVKYVSERDNFPPLTILTSNGTNDSHTIWTETEPTVEILARVTLLAKYAINIVQETLFNDFSVEPFFKPSFEGYDLIIHLKSREVRESLVHDFEKPSIAMKQRRPFIPHADYNPVASYLRELRSAYKHVAIFFYNPFGGHAIAVLFKPTIFESTELKMIELNGQSIDANDKTMKFDRTQLKTDFAIIGNGLVDRIEDKQN